MTLESEIAFLGALSNTRKTPAPNVTEQGFVCIPILQHGTIDLEWYLAKHSQEMFVTSVGEVGINIALGPRIENSEN